MAFIILDTFLGRNMNLFADDGPLRNDGNIHIVFKYSLNCIISFTVSQNVNKFYSYQHF